MYAYTLIDRCAVGLPGVDVLRRGALQRPARWPAAGLTPLGLHLFNLRLNTEATHIAAETPQTTHHPLGHHRPGGIDGLPSYPWRPRRP